MVRLAVILYQPHPPACASSVTFAESRLLRSGRCHESEVMAALRRELPRYRSSEVLPEAVLRDLIRKWHPDADRTPNGFYRNLSLVPRVNMFTGKVEGPSAAITTTASGAVPGQGTVAAAVSAAVTPPHEGLSGGDGGNKSAQ